MRSTVPGAGNGSSRHARPSGVATAEIGRLSLLPGQNRLPGATVRMVAVNLGGDRGDVTLYFHPPRRIEDVVRLRNVIAAWAISLDGGDAA